MLDTDCGPVDNDINTTRTGVRANPKIGDPSATPLSIATRQVNGADSGMRRTVATPNRCSASHCRTGRISRSALYRVTHSNPRRCRPPFSPTRHQVRRHRGPDQGWPHRASDSAVRRTHTHNEAGTERMSSALSTGWNADPNARNGGPVELGRIDGVRTNGGTRSMGQRRPHTCNPHHSGLGCTRPLRSSPGPSYMAMA